MNSTNPTTVTLRVCCGSKAKRSNLVLSVESSIRDLVFLVASTVGLDPLKIQLRHISPPSPITDCTGNELISSCGLVDRCVFGAEEASPPTLISVSVSVAAETNSQTDSSRSNIAESLLEQGFHGEAVAAALRLTSDFNTALELCLEYEGSSALPMTDGNNTISVNEIGVQDNSESLKSGISIFPIDADNSCLFNAVATLLDEPASGLKYRHQCADVIASDPTVSSLSEAQLGKSSEAYASSRVERGGSENSTPVFC